METEKGKYRPVVAVVLDGFGVAPKYEGNAVELAHKPVFDHLKKKFLYTELGASGEDVGLEADKMSGSEVGHMNIGAGRVIKQESKSISESIDNETFFDNVELCGAMSQVKQFESSLHLMGLLSNGDSPHSRIKHFEALLELAKRNGIRRVFVHFFTDGRDSKPKSAMEHLEDWRATMKKVGIGKIASMGGRFYGMDRAKNWDRLKLAYAAIAAGKGEKAASAEEAIEKAYANGLTDEFILPTVIVNGDGRAIAHVEDNDSLIFFNLRSDRARQLTKLFVLDECAETVLPEPRLKNLFFVALTEFGPNINVHTAFAGKRIANTLPNALTGLRQLYISETEKFAHVTYFLNGGFPEPVAAEERIMIPSPDVKSYAETPRMSAPMVTDVILKYLKEEAYNFVLVNYPNPDMLGHTGQIKEAIEGIEYVDKCLGRLWKEIEKKDGCMFIMADHGNADEMIDKKDGSVLTFHTKNPVPFIAACKNLRGRKLEAGGKLGNVAPTLLDILGRGKEEEMINSLLQ